jgi:hypothetical protein
MDHSQWSSTARPYRPEATGTVDVTVLVWGSIRWTLLGSLCLTQTAPAPTAIVLGFPATGIDVVAVLVCGSIRATVRDRPLGTHMEPTPRGAARGSLQPT